MFNVSILLIKLLFVYLFSTRVRVCKVNAQVPYYSNIDLEFVSEVITYNTDKNGTVFE